MNYWLEHCEPPRPKPDVFLWDVFVSYRSLDRVWAVGLYDMLVQCGYKVFVDQFVLVPGGGLASQLGKHLQRSSSGVLLWSKNTADSVWVENEYNLMVARKAATAQTKNPFYFVVADLDKTELDGLAGGDFYLDFSSYPDGPMGADLVRLTCGLQGKPLSEEAVKRVVAYDKKFKSEPNDLAAARKAKQYDSILERIKSRDVCYTTSATLLGVAVDQLIRAKQYEKALEGLKVALERFPNSLRLRQQQGLALRRNLKLDESLRVMNLLYEEGHRDSETLGILAAAHADSWEAELKAGNTRDARDALEAARNMYRESFTSVPTQTYVGINAASKSAMLGELDDARRIAGQVLSLLELARAARQGAKSQDYWERVTEPEALLLLGRYDQVLSLYHDARVEFRDEKGSIESTAKQIERLLPVLDVPPALAAALRDEFGISA
jgi:tetratricopeptide (TPR) repeat protein